MDRTLRSLVTDVAGVVVLVLSGASALGQTAIISGGGSLVDSRTATEIFTNVESGCCGAYGLTGVGDVVAWGGSSSPGAPLPSPGVRFTRISVAAGVGASLRDDGQISVWGYTTPELLAVPPLPSGTKYLDVVTGAGHVVALRSDGNVVAWGQQSYSGILTVPPLPTGVTYVQIASGWAHSVALRSDNQVVMWGTTYPYNPAYGDVVPALPPGLGYTEIWCGQHTGFARRSDGSIVCWGSPNLVAQLPALPPGVIYTRFSADFHAAWALRSDGKIEVLEYVHSGQYDPPPLPVGMKYIDAEIGVCLRSDGRPVGMGLKNPIPAPTPSSYYVELCPTLGYDRLIRCSDGSLVGWGSNVLGQLSIPSLPAGLRYVSASSGVGFSLALHDDGTLIAWGDAAFGQLAVPPLPLGVTYTRACAGGFHAAAVRSDGVLVAWGHNSDGQIDVPPAPAGLKYVDVSCGSYHTYGLLSDGSVQAWGSNANQQLFVGAGPCDAIDASYSCGAGLLKTGKIRTWPSSGPASPPPGVSFTQIAAGGVNYVTALMSDGRVFTREAQASLHPPFLDSFDAIPGRHCLQVEYDSTSGPIAIYEVPCTHPVVYCTAKPNSLGCTPSIGSSGAASALSTSPFLVTGANFVNNKNGVLLYSSIQAATPFQGGTLCIAPTATHSPVLNSGGSSSGMDCSGAFAWDFNQRIQSGVDPTLIPKAVVYAQFFARDPADPTGFGTSLSNALRFDICP